MRKKPDLSAWASVVYCSAPKDLSRETAEHLSMLTTQLMSQHYRILMESVEIVATTKNAETKRSRLALCRQHYNELLRFKPFCNAEQLKMIEMAKKAVKGIL